MHYMNIAMSRSRKTYFPAVVAQATFDACIEKAASNEEPKPKALD
jgi:hypothetical protein